MKFVDIFDVKFAVTNYAEVTRLIIQHAVEHESYSVFSLPVFGVIHIKKDDEFKEATEVSDLIVPDGQPVRWAMNYFYDARLKDRVYGPKLVREVLKEANKHRLKIFLYGGATDQVLKKFAEFIELHYPEILIVGLYRETDINVTTLNSESIRSSGASIVLVGLGCPRQEKWIARNQVGSNAVMLGVGAAFSFYAGDVNMAPGWIQKIGLEWFYRILQEPKRLWRRYLVTNSYFIWLVLVKFSLDCVSRVKKVFGRV